MNDVENMLRNEFRAVDEVLPPSSPAVSAVLAQGHSIRRRHHMYVAAAAGVAALAVVFAVLPLTGPPRTNHAPPAAPSVSDVRQLDPAEAMRQLKATKPDLAGEAVEAWSWTDQHGANLFLLTRQVTEKAAEPQIALNGVLRAYHGTDLGSAAAKVTTPLTETNNFGLSGVDAPCDLDGGIDFVSQSVQVDDADRNGTAEVTVGWWQECVGDESAANVNLTLITGERAYTLTGQGSPRAPKPAEQRAHVFAAGSTAVKPLPTPAAATWPAGTLPAATRLFGRLFR